MTKHQATDSRKTDSSLSKLILDEYPYPIAVNYQKILEIDNWEKRTRLAVDIFEYGMRAITLGVLSQYLIRDLHQVSDPELDRRLYQKLSKPSLGDWVEFLFMSLRAYGGKRKLFFMPELYDLYWDTTQTPNQPRGKVRGPFDRLVEIRNDLAHTLHPDADQAWEPLGREALENLDRVLEQFTFLQKYDLIHILGSSGKDYNYERYTGQEITQLRGRLRTNKKNELLREGWFYLSSQERVVLPLHPLLIYWSNPGGIEWLKGEEFDVAVYSRLFKEAVEYVNTVLRYTTKQDDPNLIAQFRNLIYYNLEHVKLAQGPLRRERDQRARGAALQEISLEDLERAFRGITTQQMSAVQLKYRQDLYLQRDRTFQQFQDFLASDKRAFVLTGKSGVGKSNFVLSLLDEFALDKQVLPLLFDGARLAPEGTLAQLISQDLARRLDLENSPNGDMFDLLDRQNLLKDKHLVLVFDAPNENANPSAMLQKIDQLIYEMDYPWLKVLITSRPQAWRTMKRGLRLAEDRYYQPKGSDERWVEMEAFIVKLEDFRRDELRQAYDKYQREFSLQTRYEQLNPEIRELLRDPLILRLVADIYQDQTIPGHIRPSEIYAQYIQALIESERLRARDLLFLEQELVPLMLSPGHYANKVTASQVEQARTSDGHPLWELVHNDDRLSSGERVNASFSRLVDAEVILLQGTPTEYEISFKYERFYEYFAGRRLGVLLQDKAEIADRSQAYTELIAAIREHPYLWGAVQSALLNDLKEPERKSDQLIVALAQTIDQLTKDMIVSVLTTFGQENLKNAGDICLSLLKLKPSAPAKGVDDEILPKFGSSQDDKMTDLVSRYLKATAVSQVHMAKKAAIEVAYNLRIGRVLEEAARDKESAVRAVVAQYVYYLWRNDEEKAFQVLGTISARIPGRWRIPDVKALEVCLGVSLMILFFHFGEVEKRGKFLGRLQEMWKGILGHLLFVSPQEHGLAGRLRGALREGLLYFGVRIMTATAGQAEEGGVIFSLPELRSFFPPSEDHKRIFKRIVPQAEAVHCKDCEPLSEVMDILKEAMQERDMLTTYACFVGLLSNVIGRPDESLPVIKELFEEGLQNPPPVKYPGAPPAGLMMPILIWCIRNLLYGFRYSSQPLHREDISEEVLNTYGDFLWRFEERYNSWCSSNSGKYRTLELSSYTYFYYLFHEEVESPLLNDMISKAIQEKDMSALVYYIVGFASIGTHPAWRGAKPAVQSLDFLLRKLNDAGLRDDLVAPLTLAFANLRAYHPNIVDDLFAELKEEELPQEMKRVIQSRGATESLGLLLGTAGAWFARDLLVDEDPQAREMITWLLDQAIQSQNMNQWLRELLKKIINFIYGQPVFQSRN